jgi:hypothetical protein
MNVIKQYEWNYLFILLDGPALKAWYIPGSSFAVLRANIGLAIAQAGLAP